MHTQTVYGIVRQSSGNIWVYSEPGIGTTFKICLPRVDSKEALTTPVPKAAPKGGSETILLVEDDVDIRELVADMLKAGGYEVVKAESTKAALEAARTNTATIDLLLADIILPEMSGVALYERVRASRPEIKRLYMTGYASSELSRRGPLESESDAVILEKPFDENDLLASVRAVRDCKDSGSTSR